jgi:hypothetical protein
MAYTRKMYDNCTLAVESQTNTSLTSYNMFLGKYKNDNKCQNTFGVFNIVEVPRPTNYVDLESDFKGLNAKSSCNPVNVCRGRATCVHK